jgi:hypothetical protein
MYLKLKIISFLYILFIANAFPINAQQDNNISKSYYEYNSKNIFEDYRYVHKDDQSKSLLGFNISSEYNKFKSNFSVRLIDKNTPILDGSYALYKIKNSHVGIGKIDRNWSFSPNTSLILSKNARPGTSIFYKIQGNKNYNKTMLSPYGPWSIEVFNAQINTTQNEKDSMLFGGRAIISPLKNLNLEIVKTSQWGGNKSNNSLSGLLPAIVGNTNDGKNSNINQLAGFGLSYLIPLKNTSLRLYGQAVGEDEANNLPSCYIKLIGFELENIFKRINTFGVEFIDTRISKTQNGFCGPNTAYNNLEYKYTNNDIVMGAPIDSEGTSLNFWAVSNLSETIQMDYSLKRINVNDDNWSMHRLSSSNEYGWLATGTIAWKINNFSLSGGVNYHSFHLDKSKIQKGLGINLSSSIFF